MSTKFVLKECLMADADTYGILSNRMLMMHAFHNGKVA